MSDAAGEGSDANQPKTVKDKACLYCGQAFTSSSLGRHLDLYIREKNPKPPDGIHDIEAIRNLRGNITRRQPRSSLLGRIEVSTPTSTPKPGNKKGAPAVNGGSHNSSAKDLHAARTPTQDATKRPGLQRTNSKQVAQKAQFDVKQKLSDAMDTARAAELALKELLISWRAAKQQANHSTPFDFDPLAMDFPALVIQCLQPPPTLFSSTQLHSSTSWAISCPGQREYGALQAYFQEEFQNWKATGALAMTAAIDDIPHAQTHGTQRDEREIVKKAEKTAAKLEKDVVDHLQNAYNVWERLAAQQRNELWVLELARGIGRKHKEAEKMKEQQLRLEQENANLKLQIDQLIRWQQPGEFKVLPPMNIPIDRDVVAHAYAEGVKGARNIGFDLGDRHWDLSNAVAKAIERWKNAITLTRAASGGLNAQRPLDQASASNSGVVNHNNPTQSQQASVSQSSQPSQQQQQQQRPQPDKRLSTSSTIGVSSEQTSSATTTGPPSVEESSDQDADAEMDDDDSFAVAGPSPSKVDPPAQQQAQQDASRARPSMTQQQQQQQQQILQQQQMLQQQHQQGHQQLPGQQQQQQHQAQHQQRPTADMRFMVPTAAAGSMNRIPNMATMTRSMPKNMNMAAMQANTVHGTDMSMAMQGSRGDIYME